MPKGKKLSKETINVIIELYQQGLSSEVIGKQIGSKAKTVTKYLKQHDIKIRGPKKKINTQTYKEIFTLYEHGLSTYKIASKFGVTSVTILKLLKKNNVQIRDSEENKRKYSINKNFFNIIDTEEKAYFLGFLYADGYNCKQGNYVKLELEILDKEILIKLASLIYKNNPEKQIKINDRRDENKGITGYFTINSKYICKKLEELGCPQAKTFLLKYPEWLDDKLHRHFIRGYFDGDGHIGCVDKKGTGSRLKITSNHVFAADLKKIIESKVDIHLSLYKETESGTYSVAASGDRNAQKFFGWIYEHSNIYMSRKYNEYQKILSKLQNTVELIKTSTQGYSKTIIQKYGSIIGYPFDKNNAPNKPNLYNYNTGKAIIGPENLPLTAEYVWNKCGIERNKLVDFVFNYYREKGFPYPELNNNELNKECQRYKLYNINTIDNFSDTGLKTICLEIFNNDKLFIEAIKNIMGYKLEQDQNPYVYTITDSMIIMGMIYLGAGFI